MGACNPNQKISNKKMHRGPNDKWNEIQSYSFDTDQFQYLMQIQENYTDSKGAYLNPKKLGYLLVEFKRFLYLLSRGYASKQKCNVFHPPSLQTLSDKGHKQNQNGNNVASSQAPNSNDYDIETWQYFDPPSVAPSPIIDRLWRILISNTRLYKKFCQEIFNGVIDRSFDQAKNYQAYDNMLTIHSKVYESTPDYNIWPPFNSAQSLYNGITSFIYLNNSAFKEFSQYMVEKYQDPSRLSNNQVQQAYQGQQEKLRSQNRLDFDHDVHVDVNGDAHNDVHDDAHKNVHDDVQNDFHDDFHELKEEMKSDLEDHAQVKANIQNSIGVIVQPVAEAPNQNNEVQGQQEKKLIDEEIEKEPIIEQAKNEALNYKYSLKKVALGEKPDHAGAGLIKKRDDDNDNDDDNIQPEDQDQDSKLDDEKGNQEEDHALLMKDEPEQIIKEDNGQQPQKIESKVEVDNQKLESYKLSNYISDDEDKDINDVYGNHLIEQAKNLKDDWREIKKKIIRRINNEPLPEILVVSLMSQLNVTERLCREIFMEYKRFMILRELAINKESIIFSTFIKFAWQFHICEMQAYRKFCFQIFGQFQHSQHLPREVTPKLRYDYSNTLKSYQGVFHRKPSSIIWPNVDERFDNDNLDQHKFFNIRGFICDYFNSIEKQIEQKQQNQDNKQKERKQMQRKSSIKNMKIKEKPQMEADHVKDNVVKNNLEGHAVEQIDDQQNGFDGQINGERGLNGEKVNENQDDKQGVIEQVNVED